MTTNDQSMTVQEDANTIHFDGDVTALAAALARAQAAMPAALKKQLNEYFGSEYADLNAVFESVLPALNAEGCLLMLHVDCNEATGFSHCNIVIMGHGAQMVFSSSCPMGKGGGPQGWAATTTYHKRISLKSLFCLNEAPPEKGQKLDTADDDGNRAQGYYNKAAPARKAAAPTNGPGCPVCGGAMWDNRATRTGKQPDYRCKDRACASDKGVLWLTDDERAAFKAQLENVEDFNRPDRDDYQGGPF
tara:strand:- start:50 stop:790 length:741 start_codon:yes stop_codon:yes gene_type:complete